MSKKQFIKLYPFKPKMRCIWHIHFVGIGGDGMGGIAKILVSEGYKVSGSDLQSNLITDQLISLGVKIYFNHRPENILSANIVVISSAIPKNNPEIIAACKSYIPVVHRAEILAIMMNCRHGIAISGTHGKTTTTTMLSNICIEAGLDPTIVNGGLMKSEQNYARFGHGHYFITEADESDKSFLYLRPIVEIITNIEADHMDTYDGNFENLKESFVKFLHNLPFYGYAVMCIDDPVIRNLLPKINRKITTYGFKKSANIRIKQYHQNGFQSRFILTRQNKKPLQVSMNAPGKHNALNAAAAISVATEEGINDKVILHSLKYFQGTSRRFDFLGEFSFNLVNGKTGTAILINDYGHHPTEIRETIKTARVGWPEKKLIMLFQPHRFTRTRDLYADFVNVLSQVDILLILDIYPAGEAPIFGINSYSLCCSIYNQSNINPILISNTNQILKILVSVLTGNDLILIQGAGDVNNIASLLTENKLNVYKIRNKHK